MADSQLDSLDDRQPHPPEQPRLLRGPVSRPAQRLAHVAATPIRRLARTRPDAVADPAALHPGDAPPTAGRLLLLFDGGCGICLHTRDLFAFLDRRHRLTFDRIARHDGGLLASLTEEERYGSWHVVHPDGRMEHGAAGVAATVAELPGGAPLAWSIRRVGGPAAAGYAWFARNRGWISRGSGLIDHPQRDPRHQPGEPGHDEVLGGA